MRIHERFSLVNKTIVVTGGGGLLGRKHCEAIIEAGGSPILLDINEDNIDGALANLNREYSCKALGFVCNITKKKEVEQTLTTILKEKGKVDGLVNNAANDPKVSSNDKNYKLTRLENISENQWNADLEVGLTGAFICSQVFGEHMANNGNGVILNIASDLSIISPDQRIYRKKNLPNDEQPVKPVTYTVVKAGLVGLTKYLATYWASNGVRVNALSPGGVFNNQDKEFLKKVTELIPMGRMAHIDEYKEIVVYLLSDASSYVTGTNVIADGGRTCW